MNHTTWSVEFGSYDMNHIIWIMVYGPLNIGSRSNKNMCLVKYKIASPFVRSLNKKWARSEAQAAVCMPHTVCGIFYVYRTIDYGTKAFIKVYIGPQ